MTYFTRTVPLQDISIRSGGDGRTVEAYATPFNSPTEIHDQDGHYNEVIAPSAFDKTLAERGIRFGVFYNHALTLHGTPSERGSMPIGTPLEVQADGVGLRTVTRYNKTPLADEVLEAINNGDIRGQSFSGRMIQSKPGRPPYRSRNGQLQTVTRSEIALREYGPTPFPAYEDASIIGVRSIIGQLRELGGLDLEGLKELLARAAIMTHHTAVVDKPWDGPAQIAAADDEADLHWMCAWVESGADPALKGSYKFPHHDAGTATPANVAGVRDALARLADADIPDADRAGVEAHLRVHLNDFNHKHASTTPPKEEPGTRSDTPSGAVTDEPDADGAHSGPVLTRVEARARLLKRGILL
jgi:HK97 family phage prohead protease